MAVPLQHEMNFGQIWSVRFRQTVLPPEVDSGTVVHPIRADQSTIIRPLTCNAVFEPVPVSSGRQQLARKIQAILPAMALATTDAIIKLELAVGVKEAAAYNRAANEILHSLGRS
jgi:hypothetical protein